MNRNYPVVSIFIIVCSFLLMTGCSRQALVTEAQADLNQAAPEITFESVILDFGQVSPGTVNIGRFQFTNTGEDVLEITEVEQCCGVVATLDKTEYEPGQSGVLKVVYQAPRTANVINRTVYLNNNDKYNPRVALTVKAEIVMKVDWEPKTVRLFPQQENADCPDITFKSVDGDKSFSIGSFVSSGNCITADFDPSVRATQFILQPKVNIAELMKYTRGIINISLVYPEPNEPTETVTIVFNMVERITITPPLIVMFYSEPYETIIRPLTVVKNYGDDFEVESISSKDGHVDVLGRKDINNGFQFELEITPAPVEDDGRFSDTLTITLKDGQKMEVFCRGVRSVPDEEPQQVQPDQAQE